MLRGSRDFSSRGEYERFLSKLFTQLNAGRKDRFKEERDVLRRLPPNRLDSYKKLKVRVGPSSTIRVNHNVYSVHSRLIRETIEVRLYMEYLGNMVRTATDRNPSTFARKKINITSSTDILSTG